MSTLLSDHRPSPAYRRRASLQKKATYFFSSTREKRTEVAKFASELEALGETVAIGGFLRDLLLDGNRRFSSDVDFVVKPASLKEFERKMRSLNAERNRFGGYAIQLARWKVEVWPLSTTWAAVHQHVEVNAIPDLLKVTFFTWDSILYSVSKKRIIATEDYFDKVDQRVLDINLRPNPNPTGNAIRAIRYAHRWGAYVSRPLADHIACQLRDNDWSDLVRYEYRSFPNPILRFLDPEAMQSALDSFLRSSRTVHKLHAYPEQMSMELGMSRRNSAEHVRVQSKYRNHTLIRNTE